MAVIVPTVTTVSPKLVSVTSQNTTSYDEVINSMGSVVYRINKMFFKGSQIAQILENMTFYKYDANGNVEQKILVPTVDPNQYQNTLFLEMDRNKYVLDGFLSLSFFLQPSSTVLLYLYCDEFSVSDFLKELDEFPVDFLKTYDFYNDFKDTLE